MPWDADKSTAADPDNPAPDEQLTADEWDAHVTEGHFPSDELNFGVDAGGDPVITDPQNGGETVMRYDRAAGSWVIDSLNTEDLSNAIEFATDDSPSAGINEAVGNLPSGGGIVVAQRGSHALSEQPLLPDNVTLIIPAGCELYPASDFTPQKTPTFSGRDIHAVITNDDQTNGNANVHVKGDGRVHDENDNLDPNNSLAGVMLHKCSDSTVEEIEADHIAEDISQEGGPSGADNARFFGILLAQCSDSKIKDAHAHHTGDDSLGIRRSSKDCEIINSRSHDAVFGHAAQASSSDSYLGAPDGPCEDISVRGCNLGPINGTAWSEAGLAYHSVHGGEIKDNNIHGTGSGVLTLGGTRDIDIDTPVKDVATRGVDLRRGSRNISVRGKITLSNAGTEGVRVMDEQGDIRDIDIDVTVTMESPTYIADERAVTVYGNNGNTIENVSIDVTAHDLGEQAVDVLALTTGTEIRNVAVSSVTSIECYRGVRVIATDGTAEDVTVNGGTVRETGTAEFAFSNADTVGVLFSGVTDCICEGVRANVSGTAFLEESGADYNLFNSVNGRGSGAAAPQTVGANTMVGTVQTE